jgi:hypothetical protein
LADQAVAAAEQFLQLQQQQQVLDLLLDLQQAQVMEVLQVVRLQQLATAVVAAEILLMAPAEQVGPGEAQQAPQDLLLQDTGQVVAGEAEDHLQAAQAATALADISSLKNLVL